MKALDFLKSPARAGSGMFVISGSESFLRRQAVEHVRAAYPAEVELVVLYGQSRQDREGVELSQLLDELRTRDLFGGDRLVHVRSCDQLVSDHKKQLERFIAAGEAVHPFILEGEGITPKTMKAAPRTGLLGAIAKAGGVIVTCAPLYDTSFGGRGPAWDSPLSRWVQQRARQLGKQLGIEDAWRLHRQAGTNLGRLDAELQKLALAALDRDQITAADVETVATGGRQAPVWRFCEAVADRDLPGSLELSRILFEQGARDGSGRTVRDPASVAAYAQRSLAGRLQKVLRVREMMDGGMAFDAAAQEVRETPWGKQRLRAQVEAFQDTDDRTRVLRALRLLERGLKSTGGDPRLLLERFCVQGIGRQRGRGA